MPDSRKTGVSATWIMWAIVSSAEPVLSMPNIEAYYVDNTRISSKAG